jgi:hypothetical protein
LVLKKKKKRHSQWLSDSADSVLKLKEVGWDMSDSYKGYFYLLPGASVAQTYFFVAHTLIVCFKSSHTLS